MSTTSALLGSPAFFTPSLFNLQNTADRLASSTAKLSSGNRIVRASDDVAGLSIATRLKSQLSGLRQATQNVAQSDSMLQVAVGGLNTITDLLDSMRALAVQSNSSSLTSTDRTFLQQQFTEYLNEIDRVARTTSFNGINLLDGTLSGQNKALTSTTAATKATATITLSQNMVAGEEVIVNGIAFEADADFAVGLTAAATASNLYAALAASTDAAVSKVNYVNTGGGVITINAKSGGELGNNFTIDMSDLSTTFSVGGAVTNATDVYTLTGGEDDGLSVNSTKAVGTIGDPLITTQAQTPASVTLTLSGAAGNGEKLRFDDGNGGLIEFNFATTASTALDIQIGANTEETLQNAIDTITTYTEANAASDNYGLRQLEFRISGNSLVISNRTTGNATDLDGAALDITESLTNGSLSAAAFSNGTATGVDVSGVNNGDFIGTIGGFEATYVSSDVVDVSLTVGDSTYTARISDTDPTGNTTVRFSSSSGGYFDIQLDGGEGSAVADQDDADDYADRLNAAFSSLSFVQERNVTSFDASGDFVGAEVKLQLDDFTDVRIDSIEVTAPTSTDATIDITINGETFRASSGLGETIGAYEQVRFVNIEDSNQYLTLTNGNTAQDLSDADAAADFAAALRAAFGLGEDGAGVDFQIGVDPTDVINVVVGNSRTSQLFNGTTPSIATQDAAADAQDVIDTAAYQIQGFISTIGAVQQRLENATSVINSTVLGVEQARSTFADTDIASEATIFAQETLKVNAAVAVIAQAQNLQSSLLGLLQSGANS